MYLYHYNDTIIGELWGENSTEFLSQQFSPLQNMEFDIITMILVIIFIGVSICLRKLTSYRKTLTSRNEIVQQSTNEHII